MKKKNNYIIIGLVVALLCVGLVLILFKCNDKSDYVHSFGEWTTVTAATCTEEGLKKSVCGCGEEKTEKIPATGHTFSKEWTHNDTHHRHPLTCGHAEDVAEKEEHSYNDGVCICGARAAGYGTIGLSYELNIDNVSYSCTGIGTATDTDIVIATSIDGVPITSISDFAFYECANLKSITIPDSVTSIDYWSFGKCINLKSITIPDSVTSIDYWALSGCSGLTEITFPSNLTSIEEWALSGCSSLTKVTIPTSVTSIGNSAIVNCTNLTSIIYNGTIAQWNAIRKGSWINSESSNNCKIECTDGDIQL